MRTHIRTHIQTIAQNAARSFLLSSTCLICLAAVARAEESPAPAPDVAGPQLEEVVVTANRSPVELSKVGSSITVITAEDLKSNQVVVVSDLLAKTPGVMFSRNGTVGSTTSLYIRGAETDQTAVLIDGVKLNDPSAPGGGYNFANMMIGDVSRIEVLRGAQSTLWGSQAIGGVVNILTLTPTKPFEVSADAEGGSFHSAYGRIGAGGKADRITWRVAGGYLTTDGVSNFAGGREKDGYHNYGANGRVRVEVSDAVSVDVRAVYSHGRNEFDGFPPPFFAFADTGEYGITKEFVGYGGLNFDLWGGRLRNRIAYGYTDTDRANYNPDQAVTPITFLSKGKNKRVEYQGTLSIVEGWNAVFGAESEKSSLRFSAPSSFDPNPTILTASTTINSGYAQVQGEIVKGLTLTGGVRHDSHDTFGQNTLGQAAVAWALNDGATVLRASFGQGFKAPTLYQLYSEYGNTGLRPESANSWDAGVEQHFANDAVTVSATWFQRTSSDLITFVSCPSAAEPLCTAGKFGVYKNTARARARGVELAGSVKVEKLTVQANYTLTDAKNTSPGDINFGKELARRPRNTANLTATYLWPYDISTGVTVTYAGQTFDNAGNTNILPHYTLVDLKASVPVTRNVELYGRIENLFDHAHATVRNYGWLGRGAYAGLRARF